MKANKIMTITALMSLSLGVSFNALANDAQYLNSDPIDINGYVQPEVEPTDKELENVRGQLNFAKTQSDLNKVKAKNYQKLAHETERLSETSEDLIRERAQAQQDVQAYQKKIDCLMGRISGSRCHGYKVPNKRDEVRTGRAAPIVTKQITKSHGGYGFGEAIKVLPYTGFSSFFSENEQLEAGLNVGLQIESDVSNRFAVGIGAQYTTLTTNDFAGSLNNADLTNINLNSAFGGREIKYTNLNFDIYGKFYLLNSERFRPYVGAGVGYNRSNLKYEDNEGFNNTNLQLGNEDVLSSSVSAELMLGSEISFTNTIGVQLELNYKRRIGGNLSNENSLDSAFAPDQQRLEDLSAELEEANIVSLYAAMQIKF